LIDRPLPNAGASSSACTDLEDFVDDGTENQRSIGFVLQFGAFRFLDLGDLSGNALTGLACPRDLVGPVSVYLIAHHGDYDTNVPALYSALRPRVAVMNNSASRGGDPAAFATLRALSTLEDLWQLHASHNPGAANADSRYLANVDDGTTGYAIRLRAFEDGSFELTNARTGFTQAYAKGSR
jgi:hypothetical protein